MSQVHTGSTQALVQNIMWLKSPAKHPLGRCKVQVNSILQIRQACSWYVIMHMCADMHSGAAYFS